MGGRSPLWTVGSRPEDAVPGDSSAVVSAFSASISALTANRSAFDFTTFGASEEPGSRFTNSASKFQHFHQTLGRSGESRVDGNF